MPRQVWIFQRQFSLVPLKHSMTVSTATPAPTAMSQVVNGLLAVKPLWNVAKWQARSMMIKRAERLGIPWRETVKQYQQQDWQGDWGSVVNQDLTYPDYYNASFHGYDQGHMCWDAAFEFEVAANAVHSSLYPEAGAQGDAQLRRSYHDVLLAQLPQAPQTILDLHCTVGLSSFTLQACYPQAALTGLDFSPYYVTLAHHHGQEKGADINWVHALPEATGLQAQSFDLVSAFLLFHEMPQEPTRRIFREARRLVKTGGHFTFMDMNPRSQAYLTMPAHIITLLKSTEPFMDQYFALDVEQELLEAGFDQVSIQSNSPRHRTVIASVQP
ncbi:class I SAM-dependent methyltransferase [Synechocystis salina]|uniref:Class I SAM-dependent methyltransferase n=1 Tax=Synechocystis salina LEGE 00031 TaxID=1828736 RepID=A0ABR9VWH5_9SYNC|nr:class I SAM-dependent methyltransferase [Synechocystis salina]MBE9242707.1 class I SAM-dependent methyltransferase [Synechocystis salina LEGE 00041]MBE9255709.1 class I SAM-dependent methyltransferase [Synechocystis salina LEGE 00031]